MKIQIQLNNESDTNTLGKLLADSLPTHCVVALDGTLGAGKTRLTQAFVQACDVPVEEVTSPTFTLWQTYHGTRTIHHLDAYRIKDEDEFDALGVEEIFDVDAVTLIEWAGRVEACLPKEGRLSIHLEVISEDARLATITSDSEKLAATFDAIATSALSQLG